MGWKWNKELTPLHIAIIYAIVGGAWILFSDHFLGMLPIEHQTMVFLEVIKGWFYVAFTALLLYAMIKQSFQILKNAEQKVQQSYNELETVHGELESTHQELEATHEELVAAEEELRQQFDEIQDREAYYRGLYEGVSNGILVLNGKGQVVQTNNPAQIMLGMESSAQFNIQGELFSWEELVYKFIESVDADHSLEIEVNEPGNPKRWLLGNTDSIDNTDFDEKEIVVTLIDYSEEKRLEVVTKILNEVDQMVLKGSSLKAIEEKICSYMVEKLGFVSAWVGSKEEDGRVAFSTHAGAKGISNATVRWDDSVYGQGAVGRAIRSGTSQIFEFETNDLLYSLWKNNIEEGGIKSVAAFPLLYGGSVIGAFVLYSELPDFFDSKRMTILEHLAYQLAIAVASVEERDRLERFRILAEHANEAILFIDLDGQIIDANESAESMYGYSRKELLTLNIEAFWLSIEREHAEELLTGSVNGLQYETNHKTKTGKVFPVEVGIKGANLKGKSLILAVIRDISERREAEEVIWYKAHYDELTGLPNRLLFNEHLKGELVQAKKNQTQCALILLDLDQFKLINDSLGHHLGDQLLKLVAKRIESLHVGGTLGRFGGDEFVLLLSNLEQIEDAENVARRILQVFVTPFFLDGNEVFITPSLGISFYPEDAEDIETLTKQADTAMYHAKELGRNNYQFFTKALNAKIQERLALENSLRKALEREEFVLYYQPQVDLQTGEVNGVEALIRWNSPERGLISPGVFIPIAEETGLIVPMGEWILRTACIQSLKWQEQGYPALRMSVNISARQFSEPQFIEKVAEVIQETGMDPQRLEIEITESIAMEYAGDSMEQLHRLKQLGVRIAIDDFGTGYSSMNYLRKLPIDTLKVDQSFVQDIGIDENGEAIVVTIIHLAQSLNLKVIAEGVETEKQQVFLRTNSCDEMQGYLFCKPMPPVEIEKYLHMKKNLNVE